MGQIQDPVSTFQYVCILRYVHFPHTIWKATAVKITCQESAM